MPKWFPWSGMFVAWASGGGTFMVTAQIMLSIVTIQPLWGLLFAGAVFDLLCGIIAARRSRELSFTVVENRVLTNLMILAVSKFFYILSESAHHFKAAHPMADANSITDLYPFGDWVAWVGMAFIIRSILAHAAVVGYSLPFVSEWVDRLSAKPPLVGPPPDNSNLAKPGPIVGS